MADPPTPEQVEGFCKLHLSLLKKVGALADALPAVLAELTATAVANKEGVVSACGEFGANAHDVILRLGNAVIVRLLDALGAEPGSTPGTKVQSRLSKHNREAVQRALAHLDPNELRHLEALARQESITTGRRIEAHADGGAERSTPLEEGDEQAEVSGGPSAVAKKKSTVKGEAQAKIIAALTLHHKYRDESYLNREPIAVNKLAQQAKCSKSSVSRFFQQQFGGHDKYRGLCSRESLNLVTSLKLLNQEFTPRALFGRKPPGEGGKDQD